VVGTAVAAIAARRHSLSLGATWPWRRFAGILIGSVSMAVAVSDAACSVLWMVRGDERRERQGARDRRRVRRLPAGRATPARVRFGEARAQWLRRSWRHGPGAPTANLRRELDNGTSGTRSRGPWPRWRKPSRPPPPPHPPRTVRLVRCADSPDRPSVGVDRRVRRMPKLVVVGACAREGSPGFGRILWRISWCASTSHCPVAIRR
jgi:hypothetical protein